VSDPLIEIRNLSKKYRLGVIGATTLRDETERLWNRIRGRNEAPAAAVDFWALQDLSFTIQAGETVGFIGRNGAGKSTLLKILSRITEPTRGEAILRGRVASLLEVGTGFHPELTGRENIYLNGAILGMRRREITRKLDEIIDFSGVEQHIDTPVKRYSSGMYVRLAFAVAAHLEPEILIVDEVLAVGDTEFQKKCLGKMREVSGHGRTVLFVSHNLEAIRQLCPRSIHLRNGTLVKDGPSGEVIHDYIGATGSGTKCITLAEKDNVSGDHGLRVRSVELLNGVGDRFSIPWTVPMKLRLQIDAARTVPNVNLGLGIVTPEGTPILTVHCTDDGTDAPTLAEGAHVIDVELANPLRMGTYKLIIGAHESVARTSLFYIPDAVQFDVVHPLDERLHHVEHNSGLINGSSAWNLPQP
jgi:lipopolysaccharide transport system ATP-binding protein